MRERLYAKTTAGKGHTTTVSHAIHFPSLLVIYIMNSMQQVIEGQCGKTEMCWNALTPFKLLILTYVS